MINLNNLCPIVMENFLIGGVSAMIATTCVQPIDYVKVTI